MVKIEENTLIIILPHPCPTEALAGLQAGIIATLKYQCANYKKAFGLEEKLINGNHLLLELLEATIKEEL
jgi:hypothetical protein